MKTSDTKKIVNVLYPEAHTVGENPIIILEIIPQKRMKKAFFLFSKSSMTNHIDINNKISIVKKIISGIGEKE